MKRRALLSVYDKTGIVELAKSLFDLGWELYSSSGTYSFLRKAGIEVVEVAQITGYPHILGGRVKTLHPKIFGGILARRESSVDMSEIDELSIPLMDMIVCNLYPFEQAARDVRPLEELLEEIDIGGVSLLRAGGKNFSQVIVLMDTADYSPVVEELRSDGDVSTATRERLAIKAFAATSSYDAMIVEGIKQATGFSHPEQPIDLPLVLRRRHQLRYGENPHQDAALYLPPLSNLPWEQLSGKPLSYNNILDADCAMRGCALLQGYCGALVVKHATPCGMATGETPLEAYERAYDCDSLSAYGGVVGISRKIDMEAAAALSGKFIDVLIAPGYDEGAASLLAEKKPSLRVLEWKGGRVFRDQFVGTWSGMLVQEDSLPPMPDLKKCRWIGKSRHDLKEDILLAWKAAALSKSNAISIVKNGATIGIGAGFCSRFHAARFAVEQAGEAAKGAAMGSDAFFPFPDAIEQAAKAGIAVIVQPGGSIRDEEVFAAAEKHGISMLISPNRTFRH
ncbi:MAG: bifunctional phosphoribosylaminoimidazolecarboxamide formyltransferase/IMP cyclohydrolase [Synergistaceae bacterium]|nr:bifunctional phosphoribosylaminoimidazolecarboxamide formyltransferase/IMP cyclohydrolase [Synergistaceae bacterium]